MTYDAITGLSTLLGVMPDLERGGRVRRTDWPEDAAIFIDPDTDLLMFQRGSRKPEPFSVRRQDLVDFAWDEVREAPAPSGGPSSFEFITATLTQGL